MTEPIGSNRDDAIGHRDELQYPHGYFVDRHRGKASIAMAEGPRRRRRSHKTFTYRRACSDAFFHRGETALFSVIFVFVARCLLVMIFLPFSALDKVLNHRLAVQQARQGVGSDVFATLLIVAGFTIEVTMSLAVLTGIADRLAALVLAVYCIMTAVLWKQFWRVPGFRLKAANGNRDLFWDFLKNLALAGGFLMLTIGATAEGVQRLIDHPFASSHPYTLPVPAAQTHSATERVSP